MLSCWRSLASVVEKELPSSKLRGKATENIDERISGLASSLGFSLAASRGRRLPRKLEECKSELQRDMHEPTAELINASLLSV